MKSLPEQQRMNSLLPPMSAYTQPGQPTQEPGCRPKSSVPQCNPRRSATAMT